MFIAFVGLRNANLVVANPATFVSLGSFAKSRGAAGVRGPGDHADPDDAKGNGCNSDSECWRRLCSAFCAGWPPGPTAYSLCRIRLRTWLQLDLRGALHLGLLEIIFVFLFVDLFDNVGTLVGVCEQGGFVKDGKIPRVGPGAGFGCGRNRFRRAHRNIDGDQLHRERGGSGGGREDRAQ